MPGQINCLPVEQFHHPPLIKNKRAEENKKALISQLEKTIEMRWWWWWWRENNRNVVVVVVVEGKQKKCSGGGGGGGKTI